MPPQGLETKRVVRRAGFQVSGSVALAAAVGSAGTLTLTFPTGGQGLQYVARSKMALAIATAAVANVCVINQRLPRQPMALATAANQMPTDSGVLFEVTSTKGGAVQTAAIPLPLWAGDAPEPYYTPEAERYDAGESLSIKMTNNTGIAVTVFVVLDGFKEMNISSAG